MATEKTDIAEALDMPAVVAGAKRLSVDEAVRLYRQASLHDLGRWATAVANRIHGDAACGGVRTYVIDRNINYTNVCSAQCTFCAFRRDGDEADAYTLSTQQLYQKIQELSDIGGTQILLQGGMHPDLPLAFYEDMLAGIKAKFPHIHVHGFSPPEFVEFVAVFDIDGFPRTPPKKSHELPDEVWQAKLEAIMRRLMAAGLDSIPGGGAEIFTPQVRRRIGLGKATTKQWLDVMSCGHRLGMHTSATMMFGHIEGVRDRIEHMRYVRDRQDQALASDWPGRYLAFIAWPFQRENTPLGRLPEWEGDSDEPFPGDVLAEGGEHSRAGKVLRMAGASEYLRTQAVARLFLDNIHSIGSSWVTMGPQIGQLGLFYGANDMGSVMMEENVVSAAGTTYCLNEPVLCHLIRDAGFIPAQRDNHYNILKRHDAPEDAGDASPGGADLPKAPDLAVTDWSRHRVARLHIEKADDEPQNDKAVHLPVAERS